MKQDHLDGVTTFVAVAEEKSFSAAAVRLGVTPSAISQTIRNLERRVGLALFNRNTRGVSLTEGGEQYFERVVPAVRELVAATEELGADSDKPMGLLRINVARAGQMVVLQPILRGFLDRYPDIRLDLSVENTLIDIVGRGFDAGIRFGNLVERDMVAIKVGPSISAWILASPDYLRRFGEPRHPRELIEHECVCFRLQSSGQIERWSFQKDDETIELAVNGRLIVNDSATLVQAGLDGIGIVYMINGYVERLVERGRLVRLLTDWSPTLPGFTLYYADRRRVPAKLRALIDYLREVGTTAQPAADLFAEQT